METVSLHAKKSNVCGAIIGSGGKGMSRACEISAAAAVLRLQDGGLRVFQYYVMFHVNGLHLQGS